MKNSKASSRKKMSNQRKKNFRIKVSAWNIVEHGIHEILNNNTRSLSYAELYSIAYHMVLDNFCEELYFGTIATLTSHLKEIARSIEATQGGSFLEELNNNWNDYKGALRVIRDILRYMDRTYVRSNKKTHVYELGLNLWKENVIYSNQIRSRLLNTLLELVCSERASKVIDRGLFKDITKMLMDLGSSVYVQEFETPFVKVSVEFYAKESQKFIEYCDCGDYLKNVEKRLNEEKDRVSHYLFPTTEKKITDLVEKEMIENHMLRLIHMENSGLVNMLCEDKYEDLGRMYNLFCCVNNGISKIHEVMESKLWEYVKQPVMGERKTLNDPIEVQQRLLNVKDKYDKIIKVAFNNDKQLQYAFNSQFASIFFYIF